MPHQQNFVESVQFAFVMLSFIANLKVVDAKCNKYSKSISNAIPVQSFVIQSLLYVPTCTFTCAWNKMEIESKRKGKQ